MAKRVYFGFDYEDVEDFRANVVRKSNALEGAEKAGYFDASMWEEAKKKDAASLRKLINAELENTSVTAILIGSDTYTRHWVRYEIIKSVARGNKLLGIHINSIRDTSQRTKTLGPNPFEYLALRLSADGKTATPMEWNGTAWVEFTEHGSFTFSQPIATEYRGKTTKLSTWFKNYDWMANDGYNNLKKWIE